MTHTLDVAVIGAGITGLAAAHRLRTHGLSVAVFEASARAGGVIRSERLGNVLLEHGPFSVMVRCSAFRKLIEELGLSPIRIDAGASRKRYVQRGGRLHLAPASPMSFAATSLLSPAGKLAVLAKALRSRPRSTESDTTLQEFAMRRLGRQAAARLASPGAVGVFAAEADELGLDACLPRFAAPDRAARSTIELLKAAAKHDSPQPQRTRRGRPKAQRSMISFPNGLSELVDALHSGLGETVKLSTPVESIEHADTGGGPRFRIKLPDRVAFAQRIVLAAGAPSSARALADLAPRAAARLAKIDHAGLGVVHFIFERDQIDHDLDGFGYLIPRDELRAAPALGVIWPGSVFPAHVGDGAAALRVMIGGTRWPDALDAPDDALVSQTLDVVRPVLGVVGEPAHASVVRWRASVPVYAPGHAERTRAIHDEAERTPGLFLAGGWSDGPGVNDRIREADALARRIAESAQPEHAAVSAEIVSGDAPVEAAP